MMRLVSVDPAIKTLAICKLDVNDTKISNLEMMLIDLCPEKKVKSCSFGDIMKSLFVELEKINMDGVKTVIIENIPSYKNATIKTISIGIYSFFSIKGYDTIFVNPNSKNKEIKACKTYVERKKKSIELAMDLLDDKSREKLFAFKKKDDISDCINQGFYHASKRTKNK